MQSGQWPYQLLGPAHASGSCLRVTVHIRLWGLTALDGNHGEKEDWVGVGPSRIPEKTRPPLSLWLKIQI